MCDSHLHTCSIFTDNLLILWENRFQVCFLQKQQTLKTSTGCAPLACHISMAWSWQIFMTLFGLCVGTTITDKSINVTSSRTHYSMHKFSIVLHWYGTLKVKFCLSWELVWLLDPGEITLIVSYKLPVFQETLERTHWQCLLVTLHWWQMPKKLIPNSINELIG